MSEFDQLPDQDTEETAGRQASPDDESIVVAALDGLARAGTIGPETVVRARDRYGWRG